MVFLWLRAALMRLVLIVVPAFPFSAHAYDTLPTKRLGDVAVYRPAGAPTSIVLFLSGDGGWKLGVLGWAERFQREGAMVLGVDAVKLQKVLKTDAETEECLNPSDELLDIVRDARAAYGVGADVPLVIGGFSSGASIAYVIMGQTARGTYAGALAVSFCSDLITHKPFCPGASPEMVPTLGGKLGYIYPPISSGLPGFTAFLGAKDKVCHTDAVVAFIAQVPGASIEVLPGQGHGFANDTELVNRMAARLKTLSSQTAHGG